MSDKAIVTCAVTGVLTNPEQHPVPVTVEQMAASCREAFDAGASIMHVHFRQQSAGKGHLPCWDPDVAEAMSDAIRAACPGVIINMSTGAIGSDISGPLACMERIKPEISACNAGTLNYLKTKKDGGWAWPPMIFDNSVEKVSKFLKAMESNDSMPEFECFDVGIVRQVGLYVHNGMCKMKRPDYNFVMGVASGMPTDPELLELLVKYRLPDSTWQVTAIGREEVWALHQRTADLGGMLRTGLEDTFYLPNGTKAKGNGELIDMIVGCARKAGREIASPAQAREILHLRAKV